jgi:O-acetyl-ADP-ribose deacetylase
MEISGRLSRRAHAAQCAAALICRGWCGAGGDARAGRVDVWVCHDLAMAVIEVVMGDITREHVDAIVTAANESLLGGGGVDGAIHRAAGPRLAEAGGAIGPCEPGDAMATPAFDLDPPVRHVIHTVGPIWEGGDYGEADILASCYRRSLEVADQLSARSIAFPAIATGVYGFPPDQAARIAVATIRSTPTNVERVRLVAFDDATRDRLQAALES